MPICTRRIPRIVLIIVATMGLVHMSGCSFTRPPAQSGNDSKDSVGQAERRNSDESRAQKSQAGQTYRSLFADRQLAACVANKLDVGLDDAVDGQLLDSVKYLTIDDTCASKTNSQDSPPADDTTSEEPKSQIDPTPQPEPSAPPSTVPIASLDGIEHLRNVTNLSMHSAQVSDIRVLSKLRLLRSLDLNGTSVRDVTSLAGLPIGELRLPDTVVDVLPVLRLPNLHALYVANPRADISVLRDYRPATVGHRGGAYEADEGEGLVVEMPEGTDPSLASQSAGAHVAVKVFKPADALSPYAQPDDAYTWYRH